MHHYSIQLVFRSLLAAMLLAAFSASLQAGGSGLVSMLTDKTGVSEEQAAGGAGAIFDYAKDNLSADDFASISEGVPDMDSLLSAAPKTEDSSAMGKLGGMLGDKGGSMGGLADLAGSFESLGLDPEMVSQFLPIVEQYVGDVSGADALGMLKGLF